MLRSGQGVFLEDVPEQATTAMSFIAMDAPRHTHLRRLVSLAFTPRKVASLEPAARRHARAVVDRLQEEDPGDFVVQVSGHLPTAVIADMIGIDESDRAWFAEKVDDYANWNEPGKLARYGVDHPGEVMVRTVVEMHAAFRELSEDRRRHPREDLVAALVEAEIDGQRLTDEEIGGFLSLLVVAGTDTTKQTISLAMHGLSEFPTAGGRWSTTSIATSPPRWRRWCAGRAWAWASAAPPRRTSRYRASP